jgi:hypothetical protein
MNLVERCNPKYAEHVVEINYGTVLTSIAISATTAESRPATFPKGMCTTPCVDGRNLELKSDPSALNQVLVERMSTGPVQAIFFPQDGSLPGSRL